ncbi:MAG: FliH/SctL family protein [Nitrospirota bacterium]|nr:FliH/SctL family protein [Nitrospirota bacterium]MDX2420800.1 FliH/SctL family protein [Nitrospirota bacterium]
MEQNARVKKFEMAELIPKGARDQDEEDQSHDCAELQRQAFEQGRLKGIDEGRAECQAKVDEQLNWAIQLANQIGRARVAALEEQDRDIVEVALAISQKIILREVETDKELIVRQVRQILGLLLNKNLVTLKVHPQDLHTLEPLHEALRAEFLDGDHLIIEGSQDVQSGGCLVEQVGLQLDARLHQQLEAVATEFGLEISPS